MVQAPFPKEARKLGSPAEQLEPGERDVGKARERWREQRKDKQNREKREPEEGR